MLDRFACLLGFDCIVFKLAWVRLGYVRSALHCIMYALMLRSLVYLMLWKVRTALKLMLLREQQPTHVRNSHHICIVRHIAHTHTHHQYSVRNACAHTNITSKTKLPLSNCCPGLLSLTMSAGLRRPACPITGLLRDGYTPPDLPPFGSALAVPSRVCFIVFALAHALTGTCHLF